MIELEDLMSNEKGTERRVDNHKLVLYLSQLAGELKTQNERLTALQETKEITNAELAKVLEVLKTFKTLLSIVKWVASIAGGVAIIWGGIKGHLK